MNKIMKIKSLKNQDGKLLKGLALFTPEKFYDNRGFFMETWNKKLFNKKIIQEVDFVQESHSISKLGVLRGLHYQIKPHSQGKLISCISGEIFDVAIDIRKDSKTFATWTGVYLNSENHNQFWIPEGFAHGFLTLSKSADVFYKMTSYWCKESERSILWNDNKINIKWPNVLLNENHIQPILSTKDQSSKGINNLEDHDLF